MSKHKLDKHVPCYRGKKWISPQLPKQARPWLEDKKYSVAKDRSNHASLDKALQQALGRRDWKWPKHPICFVTDLHADTDAFWASLVASGGIHKTGPKDKDFKLTRQGRKLRYIIGGDCFDKGPSNLRLLDSLQLLRKSGAHMCVLAGNHDMRMMVGINTAGQEKDLRTEHFFVRMGVKVVPFLKEIQEKYLSGRNALDGVPSTQQCRRLLYPSRQWFKEFPIMAGWMMPERVVQRELERMRAKSESFEADFAAHGMDLRMVYAAARQWQSLFLHPKGRYAWFFRDMKLAVREGTFLFIHAGFDDRTARILYEGGVGLLNKAFHRQLREDASDFYYGHLANAVRTKYRPVDHPLTSRGVDLIRRSRIRAVVHGHRNVLQGQRIMLRKGLIHFECDTTLDRHSRKQEGLKGHGASATLFKPGGKVVGISSDYPYVKVFDPKE